MEGKAGAWLRWREEEGAGAPFAEQWSRFLELDAARGPGDPPLATWEPDADLLAGCNAGRLAASRGLVSFEQLHRWTVEHRALYWERVLEALRITFASPPERILDATRGPEHPAWLPGARFNIVDSCFRGDRSRPAVISGREGETGMRTTSLGELERLVDRVVHGLRARGLEPGSSVAIYMPMTLPCVAAYLGVVKAGLRVVSVADSFPAAELARRIRIGDASLVITAEGFRRGAKTIDLYEKVRAAEAPPAVVVPLDGAAELREGDVSWDGFLGEDAPAASFVAEPDAVTNVLFSSGTTGDPKAIPWTHLTPVKAAADGRFHHDLRPGDVAAWPTNIGWMMGPWLLYASLLNDAAVALFEGSPTGREFCDFVERSGVTMLGVVPSMVKAWRAADAVDEGAWSTVRVFSSTGEASHREDVLWLTSRTGHRAPLIEYCGGTEVGGGHLTGSVMQPASPATFTTPALGIDFVVLGPGGLPAEEGATGEIFLVPPSMGLSQRLLNGNHHAVYYQGCPLLPDGRLLRRHGDAVVRLAGGRWRAEGRADDTMNLGGIKVSSLEIERVLSTHSAVFECAAVAARPRDGGPDALVVFAALRPAAHMAESQLRRELQEILSRDLNPLFRIHEVVLIDALPRTASNKTMRRELRARYGEA